jgi:hypothetical protein
MVKEEYRLRVSENRKLRGIFGPKSKKRTPSAALIWN